MADDILATLTRINEQGLQMIAAAQSVGDPLGVDKALGHWIELHVEAAAEITRLRSDNQKLREALEPFAKVTPSSLFPDDGSEAEEYWLLCGTKEDSGISNGPDFTGADLARARAALAEGNSNG